VRKSSMPGNPLISIVTVALNHSEKIKKTVASVCNQSYNNIEYLVVDGGSRDGTVEMLESCSDTVDRWISEPDGGVSDAFNKGIALARGELIGLLNAGDSYEPEAVASIVSAYLASPGTDVFCGSIRLSEPQGLVVECLSSPARLDKETSVYHPTVFVRRSAYDKFGLFDLRYKYAMDYELLLRYKRSGAIFRVLNAHLANMELDGLSSVNWYHGLSEVRMARSVYFGALDVAYHHVRAIILNVLSRSLKRFGFSGVYRSYWHYRNQRSIQRGVQPKG